MRPQCTAPLGRVASLAAAPLRPWPSQMRLLCSSPRTLRAGAAPAAGSSGGGSGGGGSSKLTTDWEARRRQRVVNELVDASKRMGPEYTREAIQGGVEAIEALLPGLQIDVEAMKASEWARLCLDVNGAALRIIALKGHWPRANLAAIAQRQPHLLLQDVSLIDQNAAQVKQLLETAKDPDALLTALPSLLEPRTLISVLVTVRKWYFNKRDPVEVIEADPELIIRAQDCDVPFEPVYMEQDGPFCPQLAYHERRTDWQAYIDQKFYGQE